jgi:DNA-binding LytR/AlgR family response regulator
MISINTIVVEDNRESREVIKIGIKKFNAQSPDIQISISGEADSYESAAAIIKNQSEQIQLVLLDIHLKGKKTGLDFSREFPHLAYIIVSIDENALKNFTNSTPARTYYYIEKASEGIISSAKIIDALNKYIDAKANDLYIKILNLGDKLPSVMVNDIAFISKRPLAIGWESGRRVINVCSVCKEDPKHKTDSLYICSNIINSNIDHPNCLRRLYKSNTSEENRSIANFIEANKLNPSKFIRISNFAIINLDYLESVIGLDFYITVKDSKANDFPSAILRASALYLDDTTKQKIANRVS